MSQYQEDETLRPVAYYVSRRLQDTESIWSLLEIELLSVVYTMNFFCHFLYGRRFMIFNDQRAVL